jgi:hypothetical protein
MTACGDRSPNFEHDLSRKPVPTFQDRALNGRKAPRGIRQNRYALSVAKERSFTKAATRLNIAANTFNLDKEPTEWRSKSQRSN